MHETPALLRSIESLSEEPRTIDQCFAHPCKLVFVGRIKHLHHADKLFLDVFDVQNVFPVDVVNPVENLALEY